MQDYYTVPEAAEILNRNVRTIQRWVIKGRFPGAQRLDANKQRSPSIIPKADVEAELARQTKEDKAEK